MEHDEKMCLCKPISPTLSIFVFALWPITTALNTIEFRFQLCFSAQRGRVMAAVLPQVDFSGQGHAGHWHLEGELITGNDAPNSFHNVYMTACISALC